MSGPPQDTVPTAAGQSTTAQGSVSNATADVTGQVICSDQKEWLYSNLLKVTLPEQVFVANTTHRFAGPVWEALRAAGGDIGPEWLLLSKQIVSFRNLRDSQWKAVCDQGTVEAFDVPDWATPDDPDQCRDFVRLLNLCMDQFAQTRGLRYSRNLDCYYFPATANLQPRNLTYQSLQQTTTREVFSVHHKKSDPETVSYFRHSAFAAAFHRYGQEWYLEITPTYVYTADGYRLSRYQGDLLAGIKRFDRNAAVIGQLAMWGDYLAPETGLFGDGYPFLRFGGLERFQVNRTINDKGWATQDSTPQAKEDGEADERTLFDGQ